MPDLVDAASARNQSGIDDGCAKAWVERGWHHLHPIIPVMPVDEVRLKSWADWKGWTERQARVAWARVFGGKCPGGLDARGRWFGVNAQKLDDLGDDGTRERVRLGDDFGRAWTMGAGVGVLGRAIPCLDVDVLDAAKADAVRWVLGRVFGPEGQCWVRVGRAPKFAIPFRWAGAGPRVRKLVLPVSEGAAGERIEVIGTGYQWVLDGVHGRTGKPYEWPGGRPEVGRLPVLCQDGLNDLMAALRRVVGLRGAAGGVRGRWDAGEAVAASEAVPITGTRLAGLLGDEALVRRLVALIPNDGGAGRGYEFYASMLHALKGASGGEDWGLDVWLGWCAAWPWDRPETNLDKWAALAPGGVRIGVEWLLSKACVREGERARMAMDLIRWRKAQPVMVVMGETGA